VARNERRAYTWFSSVINRDGMSTAFQDLATFTLPDIGEEGTVLRWTGAIAIRNLDTNDPCGGYFAAAVPQYLVGDASDRKDYFRGLIPTGGTVDSDDYPLCMPFAVTEGGDWVFQYDQRGKRKMHKGGQIVFGVNTFGSTNWQIAGVCRFLIEIH